MKRRLTVREIIAIATFSAGTLSGCVSEYGFVPDPLIDKNGDGIPDSEQTPVPERSPAAEPTSTPTSTPAPVPTQTSEPSPVPTQTSEPTPVPTQTSEPSPVPTQTSEPTPVPTSTSTPSPEPTSEPSPQPTAARNVFHPQAGATKIDMLFVVDNSGSMQENQRKLADSFGQFIKDFMVRNVDFHIGVITTDVSNETNAKYWRDRLIGFQNPQMGCLLSKSSERFLTRDSDQLVSKFQANVKVGISGSGSEQGLNAVSHFFADSRQAVGGCNDGFVRSDAMFWMGIISDENEDIRNGETPNSRVDRVLSILNGAKSTMSRGHRADFVVDLNAPKPSAPIIYPLSGYGGYSPYPEVYLAAAEKMKSSLINIETNFGKQLADTGTDIIDQAEREFKLTNVPVAGSIVVKVNGGVLVEGDANGFIYHADRNTVELVGSAAAQAVGGTVVIEYLHN